MSFYLLMNKDFIFTLFFIFENSLHSEETFLPSRCDIFRFFELYSLEIRQRLPGAERHRFLLFCGNRSEFKLVLILSNDAITTHDRVLSSCQGRGQWNQRYPTCLKCFSLRFLEAFLVNSKRELPKNYSSSQMSSGDLGVQNVLGPRASSSHLKLLATS